MFYCIITEADGDKFKYPKDLVISQILDTKKVNFYHHLKLSEAPDHINELANNNAPLIIGKPLEMGGSDCGQKYCIKKGDKNELIREVNIRLAGFGGNVPTDEFTDRTEKMIKQFQRDYMKVPETGRICGNVLKAIDEFSSKYNISAILWNQMKCSCTNGKTTPQAGDKACSGFGNGLKNEYPGLHRSMLFMLNALKFYFEKDNSDYSILSVSSGYRCWTDNHDGKRHSNGKPRSSTNHMGTALDLHFASKKLGGRKTSAVNDMETIRKDFFHKYMNAPYYASQKAKFGWESNKVGLEPAIFKSGASGATTWIHYDIREFSKEYKSDKFFIRKKEDIITKSIISLANELGFTNTCNCLGSTNI